MCEYIPYDMATTQVITTPLMRFKAIHFQLYRYIRALYPKNKKKEEHDNVYILYIFAVFNTREAFKSGIIRVSRSEDGIHCH
jgi:hypothetical protein